MPKVKPLAVDQRRVVLRTIEARMACDSHSELARRTGMAISTLTRKFREPGTLTLDEVYRITGGDITADEALTLLKGGRK